MVNKKGDIIRLTCSNCRKALCELMLRHTVIELKLNYIATCPFCNDKSLPIKAEGLFAYGGITIEDKDSPTCDDKKILTVVEYIEMINEDTVELRVKKVH